MLEGPHRLGVERRVSQSIIDSVIGLPLRFVELLVDMMTRDWPYEGCVLLWYNPRLFRCVSTYYILYFSAHLMHSGESSLSPNPPSNSEKMISGCSGIT